MGTPSLPAGYTLTEPLNTTIAAGGSDTFTVQVNTAALGTFAGEISFTTNDRQRNPFNFAITATVLPAPQDRRPGSGPEHCRRRYDAQP